jgi:hypothetical protein
VTVEDRAAYAAALEPWVRRAEREGKVIDHVSYRDGHADVVLVKRGEAMSAASAKEPLWNLRSSRGEPLTCKFQLKYANSIQGIFQL